MVHVTRETTSMVAKMEKECTRGVTDLNMMVSGLTIKYVVLAFIHGQTYFFI